MTSTEPSRGGASDPDGSSAGPKDSVLNRRELATRRREWPSRAAGMLARWGVTPDQVSMASVVFAALAGAAFWRAGAALGGGASLWLAAAIVGIQLRLLCNLLDGLLAIEGGLRSRTGELYNEIPDRIDDVLILVGAGLAVQSYRWGLLLGLFAAIFALLTAYVRLLGGTLGLKQDFGGPMAKQHRMFTLTVGSLAAAIEHAVTGTIWSLFVTLEIILFGTLLTFALRVRRMGKALNAR